MPTGRDFQLAMDVKLGERHGDPTPSSGDIELTRILIEAGNLLGVRVVDHLVIGDGRWLSIRTESGFLGWS